MDFLPELHRENSIFVTSDREFVDKVLDDKPTHSGIVLIPEAMDSDEKVTFAEIAAGFIQGYCFESRYALRNMIVYPGDDGLHTIFAGKDKLEFSWDSLTDGL
jgi:hypothetical protein